MDPSPRRPGRATGIEWVVVAYRRAPSGPTGPIAEAVGPFPTRQAAETWLSEEQDLAVGWSATVHPLRGQFVEAAQPPPDPTYT